MRRSDFTGLYAITGNTHDDMPLPDAVDAALAGGARLIQYREKSLPFDERLAQAQQLVEHCRKHAVPLIINDDIELAEACSADGVHLGSDDATPEMARMRLGAAAVIGVSCYNSPERAQAATNAGANYVAFGRFHTSTSKPAAVAAGTELLLTARRRITLPIVAIGGITPENGGPLLAAGADMLAAIHGVFGQPDIRAAAARYAALFRAPAPDYRTNTRTEKQ